MCHCHPSRAPRQKIIEYVSLPRLVLPNKPLAAQELDLGFDNVIVVDNLPVVPPEKVDKLVGTRSLVPSRLSSHTKSCCCPDENKQPICFFAESKLTTLFRLVLEGST
jgi:hypothetical protein